MFFIRIFSSHGSMIFFAIQNAARYAESAKRNSAA